jgi:SPP1 gp7 family putative phage head morphogenesis protein
VLRDAHVLSQLRTLRHKITASDYKIIDSLGREDATKKEAIFDEPWFVRYLNIWVDTYFWGHSLVEMHIEKDGNISNPWLVPREHVHPWSGQLVVNTGDTKGFPYREKPYTKTLIEIGEPEDLGLLLVVAREVIWKSYARTDWSRFSEKFGMPQVVIKANTTLESELDKKEEYARNFGTTGYLILDDEDEVTLLEKANTDYKLYLEQARFCDEQISKVIVGQTGTADEKSFVGSAEVHERTLDTYIWAMLRAAQFHINKELIPFLQENGIPVAGYRLKFDDLEKSTSTPGQSGEGQKKNLKLRSSCCGNDEIKLSDKSMTDLAKFTEAAISKIHNKKLKKGDLDADLWAFNVKEILKGIEQGTGIGFASIKYGDKYYELMTQLRKNVYVFAAFKNYNNIADMVSALNDSTGKIRTFSEFKDIASGISKVYNEDWLQTEYNTAIGQGQMALRWADFAENAELFPWLQYVAIQDDRTRPAHAALHGVTLRWDDDFWKEFFPPNGWNCRCDVRSFAKADELRPESLPSTEEVPMSFRINPGIGGELYSKEHSYFKNVGEEEKKNILEALEKLQAPK